MKKSRAAITIILLIFSVTTILTSCDKSDSIDTTTVPVEVQTAAIIKNNTFTSDTLGIEMKLPADWYISYETTPDYMGGISLISGFDSTIPINGTTPKLIFENDIISFWIAKQEVGSPGLQLIASKDEYDGINIDQVIINIKDGFIDKSDITFKDLPDLNLDGLVIKRFGITGAGFVQAMHVFLNNGYTILINCNYNYEAEYNEMVDIISLIMRIGN